MREGGVLSAYPELLNLNPGFQELGHGRLAVVMAAESSRMVHVYSIYTDWRHQPT